MLIAVVIDLTLLGFFKYYNFFIDSVAAVFSAAGAPIPITHLNIILPVGISFYTFHTMSYVIDAYRGVIKPTKNFFEFSCYVSLFSQLVAGPIVRFRQIEDDLENIDKSNQFAKIEEGISIFLIGLSKKVLIADSIATIIDPAFKNAGLMGTEGSWLLALGYTYQLYFDFSGYSDMAVGLGLMFGIRIPQNFNSPYKAVSISDFWRRWHISLSTWLRDYLYIPLGGNRRGEVRTHVNLLITMLLGGLWHGANWTFIVWGAFHGVLLTINNLFKNHVSIQLPKFIGQFITFLCVVIGWVYFRSEILGHANAVIDKMFSMQSGLLPQPVGSLVGFIFIAGLIAHIAPNTMELKHRWRPAMAYVFAGLFLLCMFRIIANENSPFLYFQF